MSLKEHLQFLILMIPTLLLLSAAAFTLAFPAQTMSEPMVAAAVVVDSDE